MIPRSRTVILAIAAALVGCRPDPARAPDLVRDVPVAPSPPPPSPPSPPSPPPPPGVPFRVERAAAVAPTRVFAVADGRLWHPVDGRWVELPIAGAVVRDVAAAGGSLWVLARGEGPNRGRIIVLRAGVANDDLEVMVDFLTADDHDPRALAAVSAREFYIGGVNPSLIRVRLNGAPQMNVYTTPAAIESLTYMPDANMMMRHAGGQVMMFRWGETMAIERPRYLFSFPGTRESLMTLRDGAVYRGPVWELPTPGERLSGASGIVPVAAATLPDERVVEVDAEGQTRLLQGGAWIPVESPSPSAPVVALAGARALTRGSCVRIDRDGAVHELVETRWERRVSPP